MPRYFNYVIFIILAVVLVISFSLTYKGGDEIIINESNYSNENILVNIYQDEGDDKIRVQMASVNPEYKIEISFNSTTSSTFAPGYSTFVLNDLDFELKTYRKWLKIIWLPYNRIELDLNREDLEKLPENSLMNFKSEFAEQLMRYYSKNQ